MKRGRQLRFLLSFAVVLIVMSLSATMMQETKAAHGGVNLPKVQCTPTCDFEIIEPNEIPVTNNNYTFDSIQPDRRVDAIGSTNGSFDDQFLIWTLSPSMEASLPVCLQLRKEQL